MKNNIRNKRIGWLEFSPSTYICKPPEHPSWEIKMWYPNFYYGKKDQYEYVGDGMYADPEYHNHRIHESCFKGKECCYTLGSFRWDDHEGIYEFQFCGDRPLQLSKENREVFWELLEYGEDMLNSYDEEDD